MENIFNALIYCLYLILKKNDFFLKKVNPVFMLFKIPYVKTFHKKKRWNPYHEHEKLWNDKIKGFNVIVSLGISGSVIFGILISSFGIISRVFNLYEYVPGFYFVIFCGMSILISYLISWRRNKYLEYFEKFEKWTVKEKRRNIIFSFLAIIAAIAYFFVGLMCC